MFQHIDNGTKKLTDEPSTALLKTTFDLGVYRPELKPISNMNNKRDSVFISKLSLVICLEDIFAYVVLTLTLNFEANPKVMQIK